MDEGKTKKITSKKYEILQEELLSYIKKNNLKPNDKLPTVREILKNTTFSFATVVKTLNEMEKEGIIKKQQGKGLFVNRVGPLIINKEIALIIPKHFSMHRIMLDILAGVREALEKANVELVVSITNMSHEKEKETIEKHVSRDIDGLIIFLEDNYRNDYSHIVELKEKKIPFVLIDRYIPELDTDYVVINNRSAMFRVCSYLKYSKNCDKIIFVPSNDTSIAASSSDEKLMGYMKAIEFFYGNDPGTIIALEDLIQNIEGLSQTYKDLGICLNHDTMIPDMHKLLQSNNKSIPSNCHIFGYNNSYDIPYYPTVEQFNNQVGRKAAEILVEKMNNPDKETVHIQIEPKLILPDANGIYSMEK